MNHRDTSPSSIDDYISGFPPEVRRILRNVRAAIRKAVHDLEESISYRISTFKLNGPLIYVAAFKSHLGLYPMTADVQATFKTELAVRLSGKGTARFPFDQPIPYGLIGKIARFTLRRNVKSSTQTGAKRPSRRKL